MIADSAAQQRVAMGVQLAFDLSRNQCPDCARIYVIHGGPRGGASRMLTCTECEAEFLADGAYEKLENAWCAMRTRDGKEDLAYRRRAREAYYDDTKEERACDNCGGLYRGPAVYCCINCAEADTWPSTNFPSVIFARCKQYLLTQSMRALLSSSLPLRIRGKVFRLALTYLSIRLESAIRRIGALLGWRPSRRRALVGDGGPHEPG